LKINGKKYPATFKFKKADWDWDGRTVMPITLKMDYATVRELFVDGIAWSLVVETPITVQTDDENSNITTETKMEVEEFDHSDFNIVGDIIVHRDGTITVKMGRPKIIEL
jgi:hypothetical protein